MYRSLAYCQACLIQVAMAKVLDDRARMDALLDAWRPNEEQQQQAGDCRRCGHHRKLRYFEMKDDLR
jgi:hypothetical protein